MDRRVTSSCSVVAGALVALGLLLVATAHATPVSQKRVAVNTDWCAAGVGGVGGGSGTIDLNCVTGTVTRAFLYWHGINNSGSGAVYDNPMVGINDNVVTGTSLGDATTNCWGAGSSRAFEADVTAFVTGNGAYRITGLSAVAGHNANGVSLVVLFDDGDTSNNRDLVFFTGNDSNNPESFPGEDPGWHAALPGINYGGGLVAAQAHLADGQSFTDGPLTFSTVNGAQGIADDAMLYDGISVPSAGTSRASNGSLWDIHSFDISPAFGGVPGDVTLNVDGLENTVDCLGLVVLMLDLEALSAPNECDIDLDGDVDRADVVAFAKACRAGTRTDCDRNGDGQFGLADVVVFARGCLGMASSAAEDLARKVMNSLS
ncbi:MAG: hypothetical protein HY615_10135 [Candidatus Rokubacteria bacterium]|nr:hypothetical protein [Candidatus Rokubacteria bacterium]